VGIVLHRKGQDTKSKAAAVDQIMAAEASQILSAAHSDEEDEDEDEEDGQAGEQPSTVAVTTRPGCYITAVQ
jgi:hypothetical protein